MHLKNLNIIGLLAICLLPSLVDASSLGYRDIFVGSSARAVGMGSAFTAAPSTNNAFLWNPSSLGFMDGLEFTFGGVPTTGSTSGRDGAFSVMASPSALGLTERNIGNLSFASWIDGWGIPAFADGTYNDELSIAGETGAVSSVPTPEVTQIVLLGYGIALNEQVSAGANLRYYQNSDPIRTNFLWSTDVGLQWTYPLEERGDSVRMGVTLSELSNDIQVDGVLIEQAPVAARAGLMYKWDIYTLLSADLVHYAQNQLEQNERFRLHLGAERWFFNGHFGVRTGYTALTAVERFGGGEWTRGVSLRNSIGQVDYAYVNGSELAEGLHWISATLRWGGSQSETTSSETAAETEGFPILMPATLETDTVAETTAKGVLLQLTERTISPNNDGVTDSTAFRFEVAKNDKWHLTIRDEYTEAVWEQSGEGSPPPEGIVWKGTTNSGKVVIDGEYEVQLHVTPAQTGKSALRDRTKIRVDLMPATVELFRKNALATVGIKTSNSNSIASWELELLDVNNTQIEQMKGNGAPPEEVVLMKAQQHPEGTYTCRLSIQDGAGNRSVQQLTLQPQQPRQMQAKFTLMVGSFALRSNAEMLVDDLRLLHPEEKIEIRTVTINAATMHRVLIGTFPERHEAEPLKQRIQETQGVEPVLIALQ